MKDENELKRDPGSFRDPAAAVYINGQCLYRRIFPSYYAEYRHFMGHIYQELLDEDLIIPHYEIKQDPPAGDFILISPTRIPFISYPYEWSFHMIKEAALITLRINEIALKNGMMLKDASAYNVQHYQGKMRFIDTSSFMFYPGNTPWPAYYQFLRNFVAPMLWIKHCSPSMGRLSEIFLDGIPIPMTAKMLPMRKKMDPKYFEHIFLQSFDIVIDNAPIVRMSSIALWAFLENLRKFVQGLEYKSSSLRNKWINYNTDAGSYTDAGQVHKLSIISCCMKGDGLAIDLGANTGIYSHAAARLGYKVVAVDNDHDCIDNIHGQDDNILPLIIDLCNPSPGIGWNNQERRSFWSRVGENNNVLALALIHHLCIRNNVPLAMVARLLAEHSRRLIIEWVPPYDKQAVKLMGNKNIPEYSEAIFLAEFNKYFDITQSFPVIESDRTIHIMERKNEQGI